MSRPGWVCTAEGTLVNRDHVVEVTASRAGEVQLHLCTGDIRTATARAAADGADPLAAAEGWVRDVLYADHGLS